MQKGVSEVHESVWRRVRVCQRRSLLWRYLRKQEGCLLRECLGKLLPVPGEWWWLLWKCMLCTWRQVLQVSICGEGPLVPSHPGYQMCFRLVLKLAPHVADEVSGPGGGCSYLTNPTLCDAKLRLVAKFGKLDSARRRLANFGASFS